MIDFGALMQIKVHWNIFKTNHPKVEPFIEDIKSTPVCENMEIAIAIRYPDGKELKTGIRVTQSDLSLLDDVQKLVKGVF